MLVDCDTECPCLHIRSDKERSARVKQLRATAREARRKRTDDSDTDDKAEPSSTSSASSGESTDDSDYAEIDKKLFDYREGGSVAAKQASGKWYYDPQKGDKKDKNVYDTICGVMEDVIANIHLHAHPFSTCSAEGYHQERTADNPKTYARCLHRARSVFVHEDAPFVLHLRYQSQMSV